MGEGGHVSEFIDFKNSFQKLAIISTAPQKQAGVFWNIPRGLQAKCNKLLSERSTLNAEITTCQQKHYKYMRAQKWRFKQQM